VIEIHAELPALPVYIARDGKRRRDLHASDPPNTRQLRWRNAAVQPAHIVGADESLLRF